MTTVTGYAAFEAGGELAEHEYQKLALKPDWIEVKITHCGICHSDIHLIDNGLGITKYPFVPGHEIVGTVVAKGDQASRFSVGDRVGIGWQSGSCGQCEYCISGNENCCLQMESTCVTQPGGYATSFSCNEQFAVRIPKEMSAAAAAPLMCGGVTVYQPLRYYNVTANQKVGVIGIGGLGHLAIQYLAKFGCDVSAISTSERKRQEALDLGASSFYTTNELDKLENKFDVLVNTTSADLDYNVYFKLIKPMGKLIVIGLGGSSVTVPAPPLVLGQRQVCGSWIGSPSMIEEMLEFSHRHSVNVKSEVFPVAKVNDAIKKVRDNKVTYRAVLEM